MKLNLFSESLDLSKLTDDEADKFIDTHKPITLWVSKDVHKKYEQIQDMSKRKFGRLLRKVISDSIQNIKIGA